MSLDAPVLHSERLTSRAQLRAPFERAFRPRAEHRVGLEHENTGFEGTSPIAYAGERGIRAVLEGFSTWGMKPFLEDDHPIAMESVGSGPQVSLEPGGQVELAGTPHHSLHALAAEQAAHVERLRAIGERLGLTFTSLGYRPLGTPADVPWMPKRRYGALRRRLEQAGTRGLEMMALTATAQANLDFSGEAELSEKVEAANAASPLITALCAASPFRNGVDSGHQSVRMQVWESVDDARCGLAPWGEHGPFSLDRYIDWALAAPMVFLRREGSYLVPEGVPFGAFMEAGWQGHTAGESDWRDHLTTLFPDVRVKSTLELRTADACGPAHAVAMCAFWRGLLEDEQSRCELPLLIPSGVRRSLRHTAAREGIHDPRLRALCSEALTLAASGLARSGHADEVALLEPLQEIASTGRSVADALVEAFARGGWAAVVERARV